MKSPGKLCLVSFFSACMVCCCSKPQQAQSKGLAASAVSVQDRANESRLKDDVNRGIGESRGNAITAAVARVSPAVVGINVVQIQRYIQRSPFDNDPFWGMFFQPREYEQRVKGLGSGFIISSEGYVLTNEHVVENATKIIVTTTDKKEYNAVLVGKDLLYDVALLKIQGGRFPFIPLGDSGDVLIGEWVIAFGNPFGLFNVNSKPTVTVGVVSATGMNFQGALKIENRSYDEMIQTDAAINGGNSGGPLVNSLGECIGINTFIISGSDYQKTSIGIGFAIPINRVKAILPELKRSGKVNRPLKVGFRFRNLTASEAAAKGISREDGVLITGVVQGSEAANTGLKSGDVVVAVEGEPVHSEDDCREAIQNAQTRQTDRIQITVYRGGRLYEANLPINEVQE
jgi:serine protease Do